MKFCVELRESFSFVPWSAPRILVRADRAETINTYLSSSFSAHFTLYFVIHPIRRLVEARIHRPLSIFDSITIRSSRVINNRESLVWQSLTSSSRGRSSWLKPDISLVSARYRLAWNPTHAPRAIKWNRRINGSDLSPCGPARIDAYRRLEKFDESVQSTRFGWYNV